MGKRNYSEKFEKQLYKIKDNATFLRVNKQIRKIVLNPEIGKPMRYNRKGTRELYVPPFRIAYSYINNEITFLELYHKDLQ